jgi:transposase
MKLTDKQYNRIAVLLPKQRGNVKIDNRTMLNALIYRCKNGCSWRGLPKEFGHWHVIYMRFSRWRQNGVMERVYEALFAEGFQGAAKYDLDSTSVKAHPNAFGCLKKGETGDREAARRVEHEDTRADGGGHAPKRLSPDRRGRA